VPGSSSSRCSRCDAAGWSVGGGCGWLAAAAAQPDAPSPNQSPPDHRTGLLLLTITIHHHPSPRGVLNTGDAEERERKANMTALLGLGALFAGWYLSNIYFNM
jgi:hypothetical protein